MKKILEQILKGRRVEPILEAQVQSVMPIAVIERVAVPVAAVFEFAAVAEQPMTVERAFHSEKLLGVYLGQIRGRKVEPILKAQAQPTMPIALMERVDVPAAAVFAAAAAVAEQPIIAERSIQK